MSFWTRRRRFLFHHKRAISFKTNRSNRSMRGIIEGLFYKCSITYPAKNEVPLFAKANITLSLKKKTVLLFLFISLILPLCWYWNISRNSCTIWFMHCIIGDNLKRKRKEWRKIYCSQFLVIFIFKIYKNSILQIL